MSYLVLSAYRAAVLLSEKGHTDLGDYKWNPHDDYQPAMDMYLGTDSTDTTPRFALGFGNYLDTITGRYLPTKFELSIGKCLRIQMTANYRRASQGLDGIGVDRDFDYYIYCGNEAWSDSYCANAPTWNSWSYYWGGNWGPVRHQSLGKAIIDDKHTDKR